MASLLDLMVTIGVDDKASDKMTKIGDSVKSGLGTAVTTGAKTIAAAATAATVAVGGIAKASFDAYASYEQLVGGVDTIFKSASDKVQKYAAQAYQTAGLSANAYMENVTSFSASLIQSLDGDTSKAADVANRAMVDMSDNANKMGTNIQDIQNAYQGFAKQNYTMLDNLKLGYGGTKSEMERLIQDASKMTDAQKELGVTVDGSSMSFANIVNAISVVQKNLDIAGTTSKEAATTIEGSVNSMQAAWTNWLTHLGDDNADMGALTTQLVQAVETAGQNIIPRVGVILSALAATISAQLPGVLSEIGGYLQSFDWSSMFSGLTTAFSAVLVTMFGLLGQVDWASVASTMYAGILTMFDQIGNFAATQLPAMFSALLASISQSGFSLQVITDLVTNLRANAGKMVDGAMAIALQLAQGLAAAMPDIIAQVPQIVTQIATTINENAPKLLVTAAQIIGTLALGLINSIPTLIANIPAILNAMFQAFMAFNWLSLGKSIVTAIGSGLSAAAGAVTAAVKSLASKISTGWASLPSKALSIGKNIVSKLAGAIRGAASSAVSAVNTMGKKIADKIGEVPGKFKTAGKNIVEGLWKGINGSVGWLLGKVGDFANSVINKAKDVLGIHSPSREFAKLGDYMMQGWANGIDKGGSKVLAAVDSVVNGTMGAANIGTLSMGAVQRSNALGGIGAVTINLNYEAGADANQMVNDIAAGLRRVAMTGA